MTSMNAITENQRTAPSWTDWKWQQRNATRSAEQLLQIFPGLAPEAYEMIRRNQETRRLQITPYTLSLIRRTTDGSAPQPDDPIWRQCVPQWATEGTTGYEYDGETENWEMPEEMVTPIAQHKYDNRIIVRLSNVCHGYCQFCYEALRTLEKDSVKEPFQQKYWAATVDYVQRRPAIEEVILSGGDPLMLTDEQLDHVLGDLRRLDREITVRVHTRALTFNPFRITEELVEVLCRHHLNALGLHVNHPVEITPEFRDAVARLRRAVPIVFANIPLLGGINDDVTTMHDLVMALYAVGVIPHYLYHFMPFSPGAAEFRTSVRRGIEIIRALKRHVSNLAVPEFVLPHRSGKHSIPLLGENEPWPQWLTDDDGHPIIRYTNWRGEVVDYFDAPAGNQV